MKNKKRASATGYVMAKIQHAATGGGAPAGWRGRCQAGFTALAEVMGCKDEMAAAMARRGFPFRCEGAIKVLAEHMDNLDVDVPEDDVNPPPTADELAEATAAMAAKPVKVAVDDGVTTSGDEDIVVSQPTSRRAKDRASK